MRAGEHKSIARGLVAGLAALLALAAAPRPAHGRGYSAGGFAIDLGEARVCFAVPVSLRDTEACRGLPPAAPGDIDTSQLDIVAAGGIRGEGENAPALVGLVQMFRSASASRHQPDAALAQRLAVDVAKAVTGSLPGTARRRKLVSRVEIVDGITVVRATVEFDGLPVGTRAGFFAHVETASTFGRDATYTVVWSGPRSSSSALARLADAATGTIRLAPALHPTVDDPPAFGRTLAIAGSAAALLAAAAYVYVVGRRRRRSARNGETERLSDELWPMQSE